MSLTSSDTNPSLQHQQRELEFNQREFDMLKRETELALKRREADLDQRQRDLDFQHKQRDADFQHKQREREFELKQRDFQQEQRDVLFQQQQHSFQQSQREAQIEAQLKVLEIEKKSLIVQQLDFDIQKRLFELDKKEHQSLLESSSFVQPVVSNFENELLWTHDENRVNCNHKNNNTDGGINSDDLVPSWSMFTPSDEKMPYRAQSSCSPMPTSSSTPCVGKTDQKGERQKKNEKKPADQTQSIVSPIPATSSTQSELNIAKAVEDRLESKWVQIKTATRQLKRLSDAVVAASDNLRSEKFTFDKFRASEVAQLESDRAAFDTECEEQVERIEKLQRESEVKVKIEVARAETADACEKKFSVIQKRKLVGEKAQSLWDIPNQQFLSTLKMVDACNKNSKHYGASETKVQIEYRCEQLSKQIHVDAVHYFDPLKFIFDTGDDKHINPYDPKVTWNAYTILSYYWKSDTDSGKAPKFTPDLKVFFSSPCISNGDWVQFHGPGTVLYQIDPGFKLTLGSLCDPDRKGSFKSITHFDEDSDDKAYNETNDEDNDEDNDENDNEDDDDDSFDSGNFDKDYGDEDCDEDCDEDGDEDDDEDGDARELESPYQIKFKWE